MVRKNRQQKIFPPVNVSDNSDNDMNNEYDNGLKCKYCDIVSLSFKEKETHEEGCEANQANVFVTSDGKTRFLCLVSISKKLIFELKLIQLRVKITSKLILM